MLKLFIYLLTNLPPWAILAGLVGIGLYLALLSSNRTFLLAVALFVIAQTFSTAENLRISLPLLGYLPAITAFLLLVGTVFKYRPFRFPFMGWCWFVITVWFTFRLAAGLYGDRAVTYGVYYLVISMMALLLGYQVTVSQSLERYLKVMSITGAIVAVILMADFFISGLAGAFRIGRLASYGLQANILGPTCAVFALYCLGYVLLGSFEKTRLLPIGMLFLTMTAALLTFSRSTIFPLVAGVLLVLFFGGVRYFKVALYGVLVAFGLYLIFAFMFSRGYLRGGQWERVFELSLSQRDIYIRELWNENIRHNFLLGQGFYGVEMGGGVLKHGDPHNSYLNLLVEQGLLGCLTVILFNITALISALRNWRSQFMTQSEIFILRHSVISMVVYMVIAAAVPNLWLHNTVMAFDFMVKTGVVLGFGQMVRFRTDEYYQYQDFGELLETQV